MTWKLSESLNRRPQWKPAALALGLFAGVAGITGCSVDDRPHDYGQRRPDIYDLDDRDAGLQSRDVNIAADQMAADLLGDPELNESQERWTLVVQSMDDKTIDHKAGTDFDIFLQALRARLAKQGRGRIQLLMNRDEFYQKRGQELEGGGGGGDEFGQTGGAAPQASRAISPNFGLTGVARDMPRRGTNYYQLEFTIYDMRDRRVAWTGLYPVKVER